MILFYRIWLKTVSIASPKEHENKRWEKWRRRAEEIACVGQNNERNSSKALESKSPLYIFGKSALSWPGGKVRAEPFVNDSNFVSWQSEMRLTSLHDFYGSWHLYICRSLFGHSTIVVASLVFIKGIWCLLYGRDFKWNWAVRSCYDCYYKQRVL